MAYKFGAEELLANGVSEYKYGNVFRHEVYANWSRVTIGPDTQQILLMLDIAKRWRGPYGILYVLKLSRLGKHTSARYQSPEPCLFDDLKRFAHTFQAYFEEDGRHHVWFMDLHSGAQLVYDNHDLIYSYGNEEDVIALLTTKGLSPGDPRIPCPHHHCYNHEYDKSEDEIMEYLKWKEFPLQEEHDDP